MMTRACLLGGLALFFSMNHAQADDGPWHDLGADGALQEVLTVGVDIFPGGLEVGGLDIQQVRVYPEGIISLDWRLAAPDRRSPRPLVELPFEGIIAPFWADLAPGACGTQSEMRWMYADEALVIEWADMPTAECDPDDPVTMSFRATLAAHAGDGAIQLRFDYAPPRETGTFDARAGVVLGGAADTVIELFPDGGVEVAPDRVKALVDGTSGGDVGVWVIEIDRDGRVVGDSDLDGIRDEADNCPNHPNALQLDNDGDADIVGIDVRGGDVCDEDDDNDGLLDGRSDNCQWQANPGQADLDDDGFGDVCDPDLDGDAVHNDVDLCPHVFDPIPADWDQDGRGDACDDDPLGLIALTQGLPSTHQKSMHRWSSILDAVRLDD